ncbi:hypothetical protein [Corynebacterium sp. 11254D000AR]
MATPYLIADSAQVTVLRSLASTAFGQYGLKLPEGVDLEDVYEVSAPGNELAYVSSLGSKRRVGGMFRRFVRADVSVTAEGEDMVPASDVERVLDEAAKRVSGDFFLESDISKAGLGPWVPMVDFHVGDIANVEIWGRVVPLAVTRIEPKRTEHSDNDWSVHVGGQLLSDSEARLAENADIYSAVVSDRRDLAGLEAKASQAAAAASRAQSAADSAQVTADSAVDAVREEAAQRQRVDDELLDAIDGQAREAERLADGLAGAVTSADFEKYDGELQRRLWGEQGEFNRISAQFQDKQGQINRQQDEINAANDAFKDQQRQINDARDSFEQSQVQINDAVDSSAQDQADLIESMTRQLESLRSQLAAVSGSVWQVGTPDDGIFSIERELVSGFNKYFLVVDGSWVGRGVVSFSYTEGYGDSARSVPGSVPIEVGTQRRFELTNDKRPYGVVVNYRVDEGLARSRELAIGAQTVGQTYSSVAPRFTTPTASTYAINVDLAWLNAHRGALYAIRIMAYGKSGSTQLGSISRDSIGPLGPAGNGRRTMTMAVEKQLAAGVEISVEAMCDHSGEFQRQVDGGSVNISWIV